MITKEMCLPSLIKKIVEVEQVNVGQEEKLVEAKWRKFSMCREKRNLVGAK